MSQVLVHEKDIVVPGQELAHGMDYLPGNGTYRFHDKILAKRLGLVMVDGRAIKIIALSGRYIPKRNDVIIGNIVDVTMNGWIFDINSAYTAMLSVRDATSEFVNRGADLRMFFELGDCVVTKIVNVTSQKLVDLTTKGPGLRKLHGGRIITVNSNKVPRIIGKQGSMVSLVKHATGCKIIVGQNGFVWLQGEPEQEVIALQTIRKIENEAHISGLTEKIQKFLEEKTGKSMRQIPFERNGQSEHSENGENGEQSEQNEGEFHE